MAQFIRYDCTDEGVRNRKSVIRYKMLINSMRKFLDRRRRTLGNPENDDSNITTVDNFDPFDIFYYPNCR